ncbi:MAG: thermonuclease family protein [Sphingomonas sp.]|nr:thermonuclease family protein [Sphingomonas sp.]
MDQPAPLAAPTEIVLPYEQVDPADAEWEARTVESEAGPSTRPVRVQGFDARTEGARATFGFCHSGGGTNCVVDGDTIWLAGQNIRIADIDAPETHEPSCVAEKRLGDRATRRLHQLVSGGTISLEGIGRDQDRYGRKLRRVLVDGANVGDTLVDEGLARWYEGGRRSWC